MKLGILTFRCTDNSRLVLQSYALQNTLAHLEAEVRIINYSEIYIDIYNEVIRPALTDL